VNRLDPPLRACTGGGPEGTQGHCRDLGSVAPGYRSFGHSGCAETTHKRWQWRWPERPVHRSGSRPAGLVPVALDQAHEDGASGDASS